MSPVDHDFHDVIVDAQKAGKNAKIHYFDVVGKVADESGMIKDTMNNELGEFVILENEVTIRLDKVITLYGRPGPAYDLYDSYANACLACEDLGQFY